MTELDPDKVKVNKNGVDVWRYFVFVLLSFNPRWCFGVIARHRLKGSTA